MSELNTEIETITDAPAGRKSRPDVLARKIRNAVAALDKLLAAAKEIGLTIELLLDFADDTTDDGRSTPVTLTDPQLHEVGVTHVREF